MELKFHRGLPGFKGANHFVVEPLEGLGEGVFARLRCTDTVYVKNSTPVENLSFLVTSPGILWREYSVHVDEAMVEDLDLTSVDDVAMLVIIHPRRPLSASTANLYSPIVINRRTGLADQFVPSVTEQEIGWSVATPLPLDRDD
jgi:flagellar assembly factor FliW